MILLGRFLKVSQFSPLESSSSLVDIGPSSVDTSVGETVVAPGLSLGIALSEVVTAIGSVWAVDTSVGETIVAPGIGLGLGVTLAKVVTIVWAGVCTSVGVGKTVAIAPGIGLGLGVTLSKVADTAIGVWAVDTSVGETIVAPGIRLGFGITLAKVVTIVWAGVGTSVGVGKSIAVAPGIGLGLSL